MSIQVECLCSLISTALDIGSGSGYLTACMAEMVGPEGKVIGVEHIKELVDMAQQNVAKHKKHLLESNRIKFVAGDGRLGYPSEGPYDCMYVFMIYILLSRDR